MPTPAHRWQARAAYLTSGEPLVRELQFDEIADLDDWIEQGPDWTAMLGLTVTYAMSPPQPLSDEEVARLAVAADHMPGRVRV